MSVQETGVARTGRRSSLAAARALDSQLNESELAARESGLMTEPVAKLEPEPEPEQRPAQDAELDRNTKLLLSSFTSGGTEPSPAATPPSDAVSASADEELVSGGKAGVAAATSLAAVAGSLDAAMKTSAAATKLKKRARKKKMKNVVSRLYQTPARATSVVGDAVTAASSRGAPAAASTSKTKAGTSSGAGVALPAVGKSKLAALVSKNVLPVVETSAMQKGGVAALVKQAQKKYTGADSCKDLHGKRYDIKEFRCVHVLCCETVADHVSQRSIVHISVVFCTGTGKNETRRF